MNRYIRKLIVEENGQITVSRSFDNGLTVIAGEKCSLIQNIVKAMLGYASTREVCPRSIRFFAEIETEETYYIRGGNQEEVNSFYFRIYKVNGEECTQEYLSQSHQSLEERSVNSFADFKRQKYPHRLFWYKNSEKYYPNRDFSKRTDGFGSTRSFRKLIKQYIENFRPIKLGSKGYWLYLLPNGKFEVRDSDGTERPALSEAETVLYHYLCFICLAEFWQGAEKIRNLHHVDRPLLISEFVERLDQSIDISSVLGKTSQIKRQILLFEQ